MGWKVVGKTDYPNKCVICVAPHTSNMDLIIGLIVYTQCVENHIFYLRKNGYFSQ